MKSTSCARLRRASTPVVLVWLVTLVACGAARQSPVIEVGLERRPVEADTGSPPLRSVPAQPPSRPALPPLAPLVVTQVDDQPRAPDLDTARLSLLMAQPISIQELLLLLVRGTRISIVPDPNVAGSFVGELKDVTVRQALELSLAPLGLDYAVEGGVVRVFERRRDTRIFPLDYVATRRTMRRTLVGGSADEQSSGTVVTAVDQNDVFASVSSGVAALLSPGGRYTVDRQAAMVQVIDYPDNLADVERYLDRVRVRVHRQVHVQVHLIEVEIGGRTAVDWPAALTAAGLTPRSGARARVARLGALADEGLESLLDAIGEQGTTTVLSSPGVVTLNNEPAVLSARSELGTPGDLLEVVLAVTPQIGAEGHVTLSVSPRVTAVSGDGKRLVAREADTLVRVRDGETVALSGWLGSLPVAPTGEGGIPRRSDLLILLTPPCSPVPRKRLDAGKDRDMYESYYGLREKPFSLTPDPKFLYRSETHGGAFELLSYAINRREGFVAITGDIGTGKTTLCRAILEQLDDRTFTALVLNPFVSEEELICQILCEFGVISREELKRCWLATVNKQGLIDTLNDFLLSLLQLDAKALVVIDEAQNLPRRVLEQIRILSNLETDTEKLLQIVLVGQPQLDMKLRSVDLRQLSQRISIRYELRPLERSEVAAYIQHRLAVAGSSSTVTFSPKAVQWVHRYTGGIPRLINLVCDRALLAGFAARTTRILPGMVDTAARSLDLRPTSLLPLTWRRRRAASVATGVGAAAVIGAVAVGLTPATTGAAQGDADGARASATRLSAVAPHTEGAVLVGSFEDESHASAVTRDLQAQGLAAYRVPLRERDGVTVWQVLIGPR